MIASRITLPRHRITKPMSARRGSGAIVKKAKIQTTTRNNIATILVGKPSFPSQNLHDDACSLQTLNDATHEMAMIYVDSIAETLRAPTC